MYKPVQIPPWGMVGRTLIPLSFAEFIKSGEILKIRCNWLPNSIHLILIPGVEDLDVILNLGFHRANIFTAHEAADLLSIANRASSMPPTVKDFARAMQGEVVARFIRHHEGERDVAHSDR